MTRKTWNYRMVQRNEAIGIYAVYYDEQDGIEGISEDPQKVIGYSVEGLNETLEWMKECTKKPLLLWEDVEGEDKFTEVPDTHDMEPDT